MPSPSVSAYYLNLAFCGSEAEKDQLWWIEITQFMVSAVISFNSTSRDGIFMSRAADQAVVGESVGVLVPMFDRLANWIEELLSCEHYKDWIPFCLMYVTFHRRQETSSERTDFEDHLSLPLTHW